MEPHRPNPRTPRSRARDGEVRRVSRVTRTIAALAAGGVAVGSAFAASSHRTAASFDPTVGASATNSGSTAGQQRGDALAAPVAAPSYTYSPPVASSGAS